MHKLSILNRNILLLLLSSIIRIETAPAQTMETLTIEFSRKTESKGKIEYTSGTLYYKNPGITLAEITDPIHQWMVFEDTVLTLYYPEQNSGFRISSKNQPVELPFFQAILAVSREDYNLSDAGFTLERNEIKQDSLISIWNPPKILEKTIGNTIIKLVNNQIAVVEVMDTKGRTISCSNFLDYVRYEQWLIPMKMQKVKYAKKKKVMTEEITYSNPHFNETLPDKVVKFEIPPEVKLEEIEW